MNTNVKKAIEIGGGAFGVVAGLRDLRKHRSGDRLEILRAVLKIAVAVVGIVIALKAAEEIVDEVAQ